MSSESIYAQRITLLRQKLRENEIDAYLIFSSDAHLSEYIPDHWKSREWLSGFTGSSGTIVITQHFVGLWTDSRYWVMAEKQLKQGGIELKKWHSQETHYLTWLKDNLPSNSTIGLDGETISIDEIKELTQLSQKYQWSINSNNDLIDEIWHERPPLPSSLIYEHTSDYTGLSRTEKIKLTRQHLITQNIKYHIISSLDDIAWLTNLRASDIEYNPLFLAYFIFTPDECLLFVDVNKLPSELAQNLHNDGITIKNYDSIYSYLNKLTHLSNVLYDPKKTTLKVKQALPKTMLSVESINPTTLFKSCKNSIEIEHTKHTMIEDGIALCEFFSWLESTLAQGEPVSELTVSDQLRYQRSLRKNFISESFATIAGFNANGAMPHYQATENDFSYLHGDGLLLIDSGAQYLTGTTDITRVVPIGKITEEQKKDYTLVLKAHIAIAQAVFPINTPGQFIDILGRSVLWKNGLDYGHGTGHGVGYFLNVHEGPQTISYRSPIFPYSGFKNGMITSNEPGIYRENQWGIRLENLMVSKYLTKSDSDNTHYLCFETLTLCPFELNCINQTLLTKEEIIWLNHYHDKVKKMLAPFLSELAMQWLIKNTQSISLN